jgi:hypothetical protein
LFPLIFPNFFWSPQELKKKNIGFLEASICDVLMVESMLRVDPTQSYGKKTKSPIQDFIDVAITVY